MATKYSGLSGNFAAQIQAFAEQAKGAIDATVREIVIEVGGSVIRMSPVGNPELWAANKVAREYNAAVAAHNSSLRDDPDNLTKGGRLKAGRRLNDGMDVKSPAGYVGGRFRGNWQFTLETPAEGELDRVDPAGTAALAELVAFANAMSAGQTAYIVNNLPYAIPLEYGHSEQAPAGMVRVTLARFQQIVDEAARSNRV